MVSGDFQKALDLYDLLLAKNTNSWQLNYCVGTLYSTTGKSGLAAQFLLRSVELNPNMPESWNNLAICFRENGLEEKAREAYDRSLALKYSPSTLANLSGLYINAAKPREALKFAEEALSMAPDIAQARTHKALALLEMEQWEEGWKWYDGRMGLPHFERREYGVPMWSGARTKLLAIHGEQGVGDEIMFMSCFEEVRKRVDDVVIECVPKLIQLFENSFGVKCYGTHQELMAHVKPTEWIAMGSMPGITGFVRHPNGYLRPTGIFEASPRVRVGYSYRGGTKATHDYLRNFPIEWWKPLINEDCENISLQYGDASGLAAKLGLLHHNEWVADLDLLASIIKTCDYVVTVCGTAAHMSGALNVPCFCLVPSKPAWRYGSTSDNMVWYNSVKLIRQKKDESWQQTIQRAKEIIDAAYGRVPGTQLAVA